MKLSRIRQALRTFHEDEQGAEGIEKLLIVAAIALPLLGVLIFFRDQLGEWVGGIWEDVKDEGEDLGNLPTN